MWVGVLGMGLCAGFPAAAPYISAIALVLIGGEALRPSGTTGAFGSDDPEDDGDPYGDGR